MADRVAPFATARMAPHRDDHPSIPTLQECADFASSFKGPVAMVWGRNDPVIARAVCEDVGLTYTPGARPLPNGHPLAAGVPTTFRSVPMPSILSSISSPGASHCPVSMPLPPGIVPVASSSPGTTRSPRDA